MKSSFVFIVNKQKYWSVMESALKEGSSTATPQTCLYCHLYTFHRFLTQLAPMLYQPSRQQDFIYYGMKTLIQKDFLFVCLYYLEQQFIFSFCITLVYFRRFYFSWVLFYFKDAQQNFFRLSYRSAVLNVLSFLSSTSGLHPVYLGFP